MQKGLWEQVKAGEIDPEAAMQILEENEEDGLGLDSQAAQKIVRFIERQKEVK